MGLASKYFSVVGHSPEMHHKKVGVIQDFEITIELLLKLQNYIISPI